MGLLDTIRIDLVDEAGVAINDSNGKPQGTIMANACGKGAQGLSSEYDITCRGLVNVPYKQDKVEYIFGKSDNSVVQEELRDEEGSGAFGLVRLISQSALSASSIVRSCGHATMGRKISTRIN